MRGPQRHKAFPTLLDLYKRDDLPGFVKEWRRLYGSEPGAVSAWFDMALANGAYDVEEDPRGG